jgi:hypothetical protein
MPQNNAQCRLILIIRREKGGMRIFDQQIPEARQSKEEPKAKKRSLRWDPV